MIYFTERKEEYMQQQEVVSIYVLGAASGTLPRASVTVVCVIPECHGHVNIRYYVGEENERPPFAACENCGNVMGLVPRTFRAVRLKALK